MKRAVRFTLTNPRAWEDAKAFAAGERLAGRIPTIEFVDATRTVLQNDHFYALYAQIGNQAQDQTIIDIKRECKLRFGLPIMCAGETVAAAKYRNIEAALRLLTWEQQ